MGSFAAPLGTLGVEITGKVDDVLAAFSQVEKEVDGMKEKFAGMADVGQQMAGLGAGLTAAITVPLAGIGMAAVSTAEQLNTARVAFTTMLGSAEAADKMLKGLQQFAATTPFEFPDLVASAQRMKALGFNAEQIIPTLRSVGDTAAAMGAGKEVIDGITTALGQMQQKGKVSAEEMMQLAERGVPGWEILAKAIGVTVPEAMKLAEKGAIQASEAVPALLAGMNEKFGGSMEAMSKTLTGQWSNMKDQLTQALIPIGQAVIPALQQLLPVVTAVLAKAGEFAAWFGQLPGPVQAAAGVMAGFAAALGPILLALGGIASVVAAAMPALTAVAGFFGTSVALLAPWALAIGAVLAALVALGVWVHDNWEPVVAVLKQAWEGMQEAWMTVWNAVTGYLTEKWNAIANAVKTVWEPIVSFFSEIWTHIGPYFTKAWEAIAGALSSVWDGIKSAASSVWNAIAGVFQKFLEWAAKIPGAQKLMNLDDAWKSAEKAAKELDKTAAATKKTGDASAAAAPKIKLAAGANKEAEAAAKKAAKAAGDHARAVSDAWDAAHKRYDVMEQEFAKTLKWFEEACAKIKGLDAQVAKSAADLATDYARSHEAMRAEATKTVEIIVPLQQRIPPEVQAAIKANKDLEQAYKDLGVTSAAELNKQYGEAKRNYELITASGTASARDIDLAWVAMEKARQDAMTAAGLAVPAEHKKMLEKMETDLGTSKTKQEGQWGELTKNVSTVFTNFAQDIAKSLFDGDLSFGEKAKGMLKSLGEAVTASFIEPATTAIGEFIGGALKNLMGGDGFGGLRQSIEDAGAAFKRIFGKGGEVSEAGPSAPGPGGAPGGGTGAAMGGLSGWITAISSVVTAISSIIQSFQLAKMETTLNAIEHNTRYVMMYLGERSDGGIIGRLYDISDKTQWIPGLLDGINLKLIDWLEPLHTDLRDIYDEVFWSKISTKAIETSMADVKGYLETTRNNTTAMKDAMTAGATWTVNFTGDPIARLVGDEIMRQLRMQGVNLV